MDKRRSSTGLGRGEGVGEVGYSPGHYRAKRHKRRIQASCLHC